MSAQTVPTLQELVVQYMMRNETLTFPNMENLTRLLILRLYEEALMGGHVEMVKKMVLSCPLACLPLGHLLTTRNGKALMTMLDGLGSLLDQQIYPRQWKLQALDFRDVSRDSPFLASTAPQGACSQAARCPRKGGQRRSDEPFKIFIDLVMQDVMSEVPYRLTTWAMERKPLVLLHSEKLQFTTWFCRKIMNALPLDYVQEVEVDGRWRRDELLWFFTYLGGMRNLRVFRFSNMSPRVLTCRGLNKQFSYKYSLQLRKLRKLRELRVHDVFFLQGKLHKILVSQTPLDKLSLNASPLRESDVQHLSVCPSTDRLKHLGLSSVTMKGMSPAPLRDLLRKVAGTLEALELDFCDIIDSQLNALVPALGDCSQLRSFCFRGNRVSLTALENLLRHTARLPQLTQAQYPAPQEVHDLIGKPSICAHKVDPDQLAPVWSVLTQLAEDLRPAHDICVYYPCCPYKCVFST